MFIKESDVRKILKEAYKGAGLHIANEEHGLELFGTTWHMYVFKEYMPKEILGAIITLTGEIPAEGEQIYYSFDQTKGQRELYGTALNQNTYQTAMEAQVENKSANSTDIVITDVYQNQYRIYTNRKDEEKVYVLPDKYREMIDAGFCNKDEEYYGCYALGSWLYWISGYMAFAYPTHIMRDEIKIRAEKLLKAGVL